MKDIDLIPKIKEIYDNGGNIMEFLRNAAGTSANSVSHILMSYDFQAGTYVKYARENPAYVARYGSEIASVVSALGDVDSLMEVGVGEATTLVNVVKHLRKTPSMIAGFDISWSRIRQAREYCSEEGIKASLFVGDLFNIPLPDNSVDVVYTSHSLEPNGGREKEGLLELFRVARKYLVLLEPAEEFADDQGKMRMRRNGYVSGLKDVIERLDWELCEYRRFPVVINPLNPTALYVVRKRTDFQSSSNFNCPISKSELTEFDDHFFSSSSLLSYPKILGIPCLLPSYAVLTSKHP